jgi:hypothetical protein
MQPADLSGEAIFLASADSDFISGQLPKGGWRKFTER